MIAFFVRLCMFRSFQLLQVEDTQGEIAAKKIIPRHQAWDNY
jgi:hypothetical protein